MGYFGLHDNFCDLPIIDELSDADFADLIDDLCEWSRTGIVPSDFVQMLLDNKWVIRPTRAYLPERIRRILPPYRAKIPAAVRALVYERDEFACRHCGATEKLTLDHIVPWSHGGGDTEENLQTLCQSCNSRKGARV